MAAEAGAPAAKRARSDEGAKGADAVADSEVFPPPARVTDGAHIVGLDEYRREYAKSVADPTAFWAEKAKRYITWWRLPAGIARGSFEVGDIEWFSDRHVESKGDQVAIIWEADEPGHSRKYTYKQVLQEVSRVANVLLAHGVRKGDTVAVYLPMIPDLAFVMLACARIGAIHSVVFAGFSSDALRDRIIDADSKIVITADEGKRGGRTLHLKHIVDHAVLEAPCVEKVFVYQRTGADVGYGPKDIKMADALEKARPFCPAVTMDAEDPLFILYTSGSTGKPKGVVHSQAGYLLYTQLTHHYVFDHREGDIYACVADCGWITGHSYIVYGPLANGATTVMFESTPAYPDYSRYWRMVEEHKITQFYTAPTAIRALMRHGEDPVNKHDLSSLRILGTVGEPINPEAWRWYYEVVGKKRCAVVDTFWQTETGGHMLTPLPACTPCKPGSACLPFFGIQPCLMDGDGKEIHGNGVQGVLCVKSPWPSIARTIWNDHKRYLTTYMAPYPGMYFTGDGAMRDTDGYYWITGRVDDVLNVSGHRLGSAEIESALVAHDSVSEAAVIGFPHDTKGQGICCYCTPVAGVSDDNEDLSAELRMQVRKVIGPFATPDFIILTTSLPKTRSGKIMRRVLRKIISQETDSLGDTSTLADPTVVDVLIAKANAAIEHKNAKAKAAAGGGGGK